MTINLTDEQKNSLDEQVRENYRNCGSYESKIITDLIDNRIQLPEGVAA